MPVDCTNCGGPNIFMEVDEPGDYDIECVRCGTIFSFGHMPKNSMVITDTDVKYYDWDGKPEKLEGKDKDDAKKIYDKHKKEKPDKVK